MVPLLLGVGVLVVETGFAKRDIVAGDSSTQDAQDETRAGS